MTWPDTISEGRITLLDRIIQGDCLEIMPSIPDKSIDMIITDPPYKKEFNGLYGKLAEASNRILVDGGVLAVMCGQSYLPELLNDMSKFLTYRWTIAYLTPGGQACQIWQRRAITFWKPVFVFSKSFHNNNWFGDVAKSPVNNNDKKHHKWGQSESGMVDLLKRLSKKETDIILDPFMGAGTTMVACKILNRRYIGIEKETEYCRIAEKRISETVVNNTLEGI